MITEESNYSQNLKHASHYIMSDADDHHDHARHDIYRPMNSNNTVPITWDLNDATLGAALHEFWRCAAATKLATDSKSARDVAYNPEHHDKMKHVQRRHFYVRDMVESHELTVPFVYTDDNIADFFTKPLEGKKFHSMRCLIMNEQH